MSKGKDFSNLQDFNNQIDIMSAAAKNVLNVDTDAKHPALAVKEAEQNKKSKRFNFMIKPTTYEELKTIADEMNVSIGSLLNLIITDYLKKR